MGLATKYLDNRGMFEEPKTVKNFKNDFWYRIEDKLTTDGVRLRYFNFNVISETKCGVWLDVFSSKKWVSKSSKKRYAYPTIEEAKKSFKMRKIRQIELLTRQLNNAKVAQSLIESILKKDMFANSLK